MSLTTKRLVDELNRRDLSPVEREYGEDMDDVYGMGDWPSQQELEDDADNQQ